MISPAQTLALALGHHQSGRLAQAEQLYREILQAEPRNAEAWHLLGMLAGQVGRHDLACEYIAQALRLWPQHVEAHSNIGVSLQALGKLDEAAAHFEQALRLRPSFAEAHYNLANLLQKKGKPAEAIPHYQQTLLSKPSYAEAHNNLGISLQDVGNLEEALACYRMALRLKPDHAEAHYNSGNIYRQQNKLRDAIASYREAGRLQPSRAETFNNLGNVLGELGQLDEALACHHQALRLKPDYAEGHGNLGSVLREQGKLVEAAASYREALRLDPGAYASHGSLGLILREQGKLDEALACYQEALRLKPDYDEGHFLLGMLRLLQGKFEEGWREYDWRRRLKRLAFRTFAQPDWDGAPLEGRTILLHPEQGLGDTLQFIRFALLVKERGGTVLFECPKELVRILRNCAGIDRLVTPGGPYPPHDVQLPLLSLPAVLKTTLETVPATVPYLYADAGLTETWHQELRGYTELKVGIIWQGNPRLSQPGCRIADQRRSIALAQFEPFARLPGIRLFSLQKGYGTDQLAAWQTRWGIVALGDRLNDFMDTVAVMMNMDLIISADTSPAHLAGALGKPVWVVLPVPECWRWLLEREDSPWYPTMRLFRQKRPGAWDEVFERMAAALPSVTRSGEPRSAQVS